ncbi:MAG: methyltransferase [Methyloceanibacter sp.]
MIQAETDALEERLSRAIEAYHEATLLYAAVKRGLPQAMGAGSWTAVDLARALGLSAPHLRRFLRGLCLVGICDERASGSYALTSFGQSLTPESHLAQKVRIVFEQYWQPWSKLDATLQSGTPAFAEVFGANVFAWRRDHPEQGALFASYLAKQTQAEAEAIHAALDTREAGRVIEIAGADDAVLAGKPPQADLYVLRGVLQNYDEADAAAILCNCRAAMADGARLVIIERLMPERAADDPTSIMLDLHMMTITGGRLRTLAEIETLLSAAGLSRQGAKRMACGLSVIEAVKPASSQR